MWQCSQQHQNREEAKFCAKCGERRLIQQPCSACGTLLEPEDLFCTSCGQRRDAGPAPAPAAPVSAPPVPATPVTAPAPAAAVPVAAPVPPPPPPVAQETAPAATPAPASVAPPAAPPEPAAEEPVVFSFGGALIEMKEDAAKQPLKAPKASRSGSASNSTGMSSTQQALISFLLFAGVLAGALYLISR